MRHLFRFTALGFLVACTAPAPAPSGGPGTAYNVPPTPAGTAPGGVVSDAGSGGGTSSSARDRRPGCQSDPSGGSVSWDSGTALDRGTTRRLGRRQRLGGGRGFGRGKQQRRCGKYRDRGSADVDADIHVVSSERHHRALRRLPLPGDGRAERVRVLICKASGYIQGAQSTVNGIFAFMGGTMPPGGAADAKATVDVQAWIHGGARP